MVATKNVEFLATVELLATSSVSSSYISNDASVATKHGISVKKNKRYIVIVINIELYV